MANQQSELDIVVKTRDETTASLKQIQSSVIRFVGAVSSLLTVFGGVVFPIRQAADFQRELINVQKTTDFSAVQIRQLGRALQELSTQIDVSAIDLAKIAAAAGQLGLGSAGVEGIRTFTETTARMASVLDISVDDAGTSLAKLVNVFKIPVTEVERLSSLLNELSNNSTAAGDQLIDIVQRIGTAGQTLTAQQSAALAALGRDLGLTVETVGTSFQKVFLDLQTKAPQVAALIGKPVEDFTNLLQTDGISALKLYLKGLADLPAEIRAATAEQITGGGRVFGLVTNLVNDAQNNFALLNARLENAKVGFEGGTSAIKEQQRVLQGFEKQLALVRNNFQNIAIAIGQQALPYLTKLAQEIQKGLSDPRFVAQVKAMAESIGEFGKSVIEAVKFVLSFSDQFGVLLRIIQVYLGLKIAGFFLDQARGLFEMGRNAKLAAQAFIQLATGQQKAQAAAQAAVAKGGQLSAPFALAQRIGQIPAQNRENQARALQTQNELLATQNRLRAAQAAQTRLVSTAQAALAQQLTAESAIVQQIAAVRAGTAQGNLRSLNAQLAAIRLQIQAERQNVAVIQQRTAARVAERQVMVGVAAQAASQAAAEAAGGLPRQLGRSFGAALAGASGVLLGIGKRLIGLLLPVAGWTLAAITIVDLIANIFGHSLNDVIEGVARLLGLQTARREAALTARIAAEAAEREADAVASLAEEYRKAQAVIESFKPDQVRDALTGGAASDFLKKTTKELTLVQARLKQNSVELKQNAANLKSVDDELTSGNASYERQAVLQNAAVGLVRQRLDLEAEIPQLLKQQEDRAKALSVFYDLDAKLLTHQLEQITSTREQLVAMEGERQKQLAQGGKVDPVLEQQIKTTEAALDTMTKKFKKAKDEATRVGVAFIDSLNPNAKAAEITRIMQEMSNIGAGVQTEATRQAERIAGEALVKEIEGKSQQLVKLRELEQVQRRTAEQARRQADDYKGQWERAVNDAQAAFRKFQETVAKGQEDIKARSANLVLANFDASEKRQQEIANRINTEARRLADKAFQEQGLSPEETRVAQQAFQDQLDAQEEVRRQQSEINRLTLEYQQTLDRAKSSQDELTKEQTLQKSLADQIAAARGRGDQEAVKALTDQLAASRARSQELLDTLNKITETLSKLRDTTVQGGVFTNAVQPIDAQKANADIAGIAGKVRDATIAAAESARVLREATELTAKDMEGAFGQTQEQIKGISERLGEVGKQIGLTLPEFVKIGTTLKTAGDEAARFHTEMLAALNGDFSNSNLSTALKQVFDLKPNPALIQQQMTEATRGLEVALQKVTFPNAKQSLQDALNTGEPVTASVRLSPAGVPGRAEGGPISGPGTGTSDSILARLSNGEYVTDARTVKAFGGPGFFAALKSIANRGGSAVASFMASFAYGIPLPAFAGGGFVGSAGRTSQAGAPGSMDVVRVDLNIGGQSVSMVGERQQAKTLVKAFRNISRGV